jgi:hypothetical protein
MNNDSFYRGIVRILSVSLYLLATQIGHTRIQGERTATVAPLTYAKFKHKGRVYVLQANSQRAAGTAQSGSFTNWQHSTSAGHRPISAASPDALLGNYAWVRSTCSDCRPDNVADVPQRIGQSGRQAASSAVQ